jgi:FkbH-like protein
MVFIDDNPVEQEFVRKTFPEIAVPQFPKSPYELKGFFKTVYETYFQAYQLTEEDKNKSAQYNSNLQREGLKNKEISIENYLSALETEITVYAANEFNISRIAQMTQKTNQFNLTTHRYETGDIKSFLEAGHLVYCAGVKDKFGDNGITAMIIIKLYSESKAAEIDSYLLSCRVLGREVENCFLQFILNSLYDLNIRVVKAKFIKTLKNMQVENFYEKNGFQKTDEVVDEKSYTLELRSKYHINDYFKINVSNN